MDRVVALPVVSVIERFLIIHVTLTLLPTSESLACSASAVMVLLIELFK